MRNLIVFCTYVVLQTVNCQVLAPFQVSVRLNEGYDSTSLTPTNAHLCNGVIISGKYVLTTASCMHVQSMFSMMSRPVNPTMIYIAAGNLTYNGNEGVKRYVVSVILHDKYNPNIMDNDIAILKLDRSLPLNNDVQWIQMDNNKTNTKDNCFQTLLNDSSKTTTQYPYSIAKNATILNSWFCEANTLSSNNNNNATLMRTNDYCLQYVVSNEHLCNASNPVYYKYHKQNVGTSLVCNNKLSGLLTTINQPANIKNCQTSKKTTAYYASIANFIDWIHFEIGFNQSVQSVKNNQTTSIGPINTQPSWTPSSSSSGIYSNTNDGAAIVKGQSNLSTSAKSDILILVLIGCFNYICYYVYTNML